MTIEHKNNGLFDYVSIVADNGKWLRRISSGEVFGEEIALGVSHYIGGNRLKSPHEDLVADFEEFDAPQEENEEGEQ